MFFSPNLKSKCIKIISIRVKDGKNLSKSIIYDVELPDFDVNKENLKWCGWERNNNGKLIPKIAAMADNMDPAKYKLIFKYYEYFIKKSSFSD